MNFLKKRLLIGLLSAVIVGCGGGGGNNTPSKENIDTTQSGKSLRKGYFTDVEGLSYKTSSGIEGVTDKKGTFEYKDSDEVTFNVAEAILGTIKAKDEVTILDFKKPSIIAQVLYSLDSDKNSDNGIDLSYLSSQDKNQKISSKILFKTVNNEKFSLEEIDPYSDKYKNFLKNHKANPVKSKEALEDELSKLIINKISSKASITNLHFSPEENTFLGLIHYYPGYLPKEKQDYVKTLLNKNSYSYRIQLLAAEKIYYAYSKKINNESQSIIDKAEEMNNKINNFKKDVNFVFKAAETVANIVEDESKFFCEIGKSEADIISDSLNDLIGKGATPASKLMLTVATKCMGVCDNQEIKGCALEAAPSVAELIAKDDDWRLDAMNRSVETINMFNECKKGLTPKCALSVAKNAFNNSYDLVTKSYQTVDLALKENKVNSLELALEYVLASNYMNLKSFDPDKETNICKLIKMYDNQKKDEYNSCLENLKNVKNAGSGYNLAQKIKDVLYNNNPDEYIRSQFNTARNKIIQVIAKKIGKGEFSYNFNDTNRYIDEINNLLGDYYSKYYNKFSSYNNNGKLNNTKIKDKVSNVLSIDITKTNTSINLDNQELTINTCIKINSPKVTRGLFLNLYLQSNREKTTFDFIDSFPSSMRGEQERCAYVTVDLNKLEDKNSNFYFDIVGELSYQLENDTSYSSYKKSINKKFALIKRIEEPQHYTISINGNLFKGGIDLASSIEGDQNEEFIYKWTIKPKGCKSKIVSSKEPYIRYNFEDGCKPDNVFAEVKLINKNTTEVLASDSKSFEPLFDYDRQLNIINNPISGRNNEIITYIPQIEGMKNSYSYSFEDNSNIIYLGNNKFKLINNEDKTLKTKLKIIVKDNNKDIASKFIDVTINPSDKGIATIGWIKKDSIPYSLEYTIKEKGTNFTQQWGLQNTSSFVLNNLRIEYVDNRSYSSLIHNKVIEKDALGVGDIWKPKLDIEVPNNAYEKNFGYFKITYENSNGKRESLVFSKSKREASVVYHISTAKEKDIYPPIVVNADFQQSFNFIRGSFEILQKNNKVKNLRVCFSPDTYMTNKECVNVNEGGYSEIQSAGLKTFEYEINKNWKNYDKLYWIIEATNVDGISPITLPSGVIKLINNDVQITATMVNPKEGIANKTIFTFEATLSKNLDNNYKVMLSLGDNGGGWLASQEMIAYNNRTKFAKAVKISEAGKNNGLRKYRVAIFEGDKQVSSWVEGSYKVFAKVDAPTNIKIVQQSNGALISWNKVKGATGYKIYTKSGSLVANLDSSKNSYLINKEYFKDKKEWYFAVSANNGVMSQYIKFVWRDSNIDDIYKEYLTGKTLYTVDKNSTTLKWYFTDDLSELIINDGEHTYQLEPNKNGLKVVKENNKYLVIKSVESSYLLLEYAEITDEGVFISHIKTVKLYFKKPNIDNGSGSDNNGPELIDGRGITISGRYIADALIYPNGGEEWRDGSKVTIEWNSNKLSGDTVSMYILWDDPSKILKALKDKSEADLENAIESEKWGYFAKGVQNSGFYEIDPSALQSNGNAYMILIVSSNGNWDISNSTFSVNDNQDDNQNSTNLDRVELYQANKTINSNSYVLSWHSVSGSDFYEVEISKDSTFNHDVEHFETSNTSFRFNNLESGYKYYFRVRARTQKDYGEWSIKTWVQIAKKEFPEFDESFQQPADGSIVDIYNFRFGWNVKNDDKFDLEYYVEVGESSNNLVYNSGWIEEKRIYWSDITSKNLKPNTDYYWRVLVREKGKDKTYYGGEYISSHIWKFTTANDGYDLSIKDIELLDEIKPNTQVRVKATIKNNGNKTIKEFYAQLKFKKGSKINEFATQPMKLFKQEIEPGGTTTIELIADFRDEIIEKNGKTYDNVIEEGVPSALIIDLPYSKDEDLNPSDNTKEYNFTYVNKNLPEIKFFSVGPKSFYDDHRLYTSIGKNIGRLDGILFNVVDDIKVTKVTLEYQLHPNDSWHLLKTYTNNDDSISGDFEWIVPNDTSFVTDEMRIRIRAYESDNSYSEKISYPFPVYNNNLVLDVENIDTQQVGEEFDVHVNAKPSTGAVLRVIEVKISNNNGRSEILYQDVAQGDGSISVPSTLSLRVPSDNRYATDNAKITFRLCDSHNNCKETVKLFEITPKIATDHIFNKTIKIYDDTTYPFPQGSRNNRVDNATYAVFVDKNNKVHVVVNSVAWWVNSGKSDFSSHVRLFEVIYDIANNSKTSPRLIYEHKSIDRQRREWVRDVFYDQKTNNIYILTNNDEAKEVKVYLDKNLKQTYSFVEDNPRSIYVNFVESRGAIFIKFFLLMQDWSRDYRMVNIDSSEVVDTEDIYHKNFRIHGDIFYSISYASAFKLIDGIRLGDEVFAHDKQDIIVLGNVKSYNSNYIDFIYQGDGLHVIDINGSIGNKTFELDNEDNLLRDDPYMTRINASIYSDGVLYAYKYREDPNRYEYKTKIRYATLSGTILYEFEVGDNFMPIGMNENKVVAVGLNEGASYIMIGDFSKALSQ